MLNRINGVRDQFFEDVDKLLFWTTVVVQCIFFLYYGYSIYTNLDSFIFLVIYAGLLFLSTISFSHFLASYRHRKKKHVKVFKKTFRIFKYVINGSMVTLNIIEIVRYGGTDMAYMLVVVSTMSLLFQVVIEYLRGFLTRYLELFITAAKMEVAPVINTVDKAKNITNIKGHLYQAIDAPFEKLFSEKESSVIELTKNEKIINDLAKKYEEKLSVKKQEKKEKKRVNKSARKERHLAKQTREKEELKEHVKMAYNRIFKKNKKK